MPAETSSLVPQRHVTTRPVGRLDGASNFARRIRSSRALEASGGAEPRWGWHSLHLSSLGFQQLLTQTNRSQSGQRLLGLRGIQPQISHFNFIAWNL